MINREILRPYVEDKLLYERKHPVFDLWIYNYTERVQYDNLWDDITRMCRGLILSEYGVVARPFGKFFNIEEHAKRGMPPIPNEPFEVYEKVDGSLGIAFFWNGEWQMATRGSFVSEQAAEGRKMLEPYLKYMDPFNTYLFEIIYPENRIVVNYGKERKLVLLDVIETKTGFSFGVNKYKDVFNVVEKYDVDDYLSVREKFSAENKEGFVVKFQSGMRVKMKFEEYVKLHKMISELTPKRIWECLSEGMDMDTILEGIPDELYKEMEYYIWDFQKAYSYIEDKCKEDYQNYLTTEEGTELPGNVRRKNAAKYFKSCKYPSILFRMLDGKNYEDLIWKVLKPEKEKE